MIISTLVFITLKHIKWGIAQWQSIRLQIERSMVQLRVPPKILLKEQIKDFRSVCFMIFFVESWIPKILNLYLQKNIRGHTELNHGPLDLQSNALPLSYTPPTCKCVIKRGLQTYKRLFHVHVSCQLALIFTNPTISYTSESKWQSSKGTLYVVLWNGYNLSACVI